VEKELEQFRQEVERLGVSEPTLQAWRRGQTPGGKKTQSSEQGAAPLKPVVVHPPKQHAPSPVATTFASEHWPSARCQAVLCARRSSTCWSCGVG
jgi:hypothetical protein